MRNVLVAGILHWGRPRGEHLKLSVIDQSPVPAGFTPADALRNTIELARLADRLGYERYCIAEHQAIEALSSPAPQCLMPRMAAGPSVTVLGSGSLPLPHCLSMQLLQP